MRVCGKVFLCSLFALLFFFCVGQLVEGPETDAPRPVNIRTETAFSTAPVPVEDAARMPRAEDAPQERAIPRTREEPPALVADPNGIPLTGGLSHLRAAYQAFPQEDMPG